MLFSHSMLGGFVMRSSLVACAAGIVLLGLLSALPAQAEPNGLALTPPMACNE
jgi:hypothetical protein